MELFIFFLQKLIDRHFQKHIIKKGINMIMKHQNLFQNHYLEEPEKDPTLVELERKIIKEKKLREREENIKFF